MEFDTGDSTAGTKFETPANPGPWEDLSLPNMIEQFKRSEAEKADALLPELDITDDEWDEVIDELRPQNPLENYQTMSERELYDELQQLEEQGKIGYSWLEQDAKELNWYEHYSEMSHEEREEAERLEREARDYYFENYLSPKLRDATPEEYKGWLRQHLAKGGEITHDYDYPMPDSFQVLTEDALLPPLAGALSVELIVPRGVNVEHKNLGHSNLYYMDSQMPSPSWVPIYDDIN